MKDAMLDHTKINLDMSRYGLDGLQLEELLMEKGIFGELVTGNILMCMTGIGNRRCDYERLYSALREIADMGRPAFLTSMTEEAGEMAQKQFLTTKRLPQKPLPAEKERVPLSEASGRVCGASIIPYPPGIPIICPGEVMDAEILDYVSALRAKGEKVMGVDDQGRVTVGKES